MIIPAFSQRARPPQYWQGVFQAFFYGDVSVVHTVSPFCDGIVK